MNYGNKEKKHIKQKPKKSQFAKCVKTLAEQLEEFRCDNVMVFEGNDAVVAGRVKKVINDSVLVLDDGVKLVRGIGIVGFERIFISICAITEFIPIDDPTAAMSNLKSSEEK